MGKRSNFERIERDFYPTPIKAVIPLIPHLPTQFTFVEPCAGDGRLVEHIESFRGGKCVLAGDIEPRRDNIEKIDALNIGTYFSDIRKINFDYFITNSPWDRKILHQLIDTLSNIKPTWLLFDADWMHTKQSIPYMDRLEKIVSVGRVKWIEGSQMTGKDNCCWYLFRKNRVNNNDTFFYGRR